MKLKQWNVFSISRRAALWLFLPCVALSVQAQSAFKMSPAQAVAQSTNMPFEMMDNFGAMTKTHYPYPILSIPREVGSNASSFMITGRITNSVFCAARATNAFRAMINAAETSNTTNLNLKAAYRRVANETGRLLMTNQVEQFHNFAIETK